MSDTITLETATARHERSLQILKNDPAAKAYVDARRAWSKKHSAMEEAERKLERVRADVKAQWAALQEAKSKLGAEAVEHFG